MPHEGSSAWCSRSPASPPLRARTTRRAWLPSQRHGKRWRTRATAPRLRARGLSPPARRPSSAAPRRCHEAAVGWSCGVCEPRRAVHRARSRAAARLRTASAVAVGGLPTRARIREERCAPDHSAPAAPSASAPGVRRARRPRRRRRPHPRATAQPRRHAVDRVRAASCAKPVKPSRVASLRGSVPVRRCPARAARLAATATSERVRPDSAAPPTSIGSRAAACREASARQAQDPLRDDVALDLRRAAHDRLRSRVEELARNRPLAE